MSTLLLLALALALGIVAGGFLFTGRGEWLLDLLLGAAAVAVAPLLKPAALVMIFGLIFASRRVPYLARSFVNTFGIHHLFVPVLFPGAKRVDNTAPADPRLDVRITSSGAQRARDVLLRKYLSESIRQDQKRLVEITGNAISGETEILPTFPPVTVDPIEAETIAKLLVSGLSVSECVQALPGYSGRKYAEFKAKVEAVKATIGSGPGA